MNPSIDFIKNMVAAMADSYKYGHFEQYPDAEEMVAYGECRGPMYADDHRIVFSGMRYIVDNFLSHKWTHQELDLLAHFMSTHNAGNTPYPWPEVLFRKFVDENNGYFPVTIQAMPEGSVIQPHVPVYQITAKAPYTLLITFLETLLTKVWYSTTVGTLDRHVWQDIYEAYEISVDPADYWTLDYRFHDFGMRGVTCEEQAIVGGMAHLLNFKGSDTVSAAIYAQYIYNQGKPIAESIPATEHSVMTARGRNGELGIVQDMISRYGKGVFATVGDSYDWANFLDVIVPACAEQMEKQGGLWVVRPDSGNPVECVLQALQAGLKNFAHHINSKGFMVLHNFAVIQGDGIGPAVVKQILEAVLDAGFSAQCVAFGMGGGLLQKVNRDTMRFATKLSQVTYSDGVAHDVMKDPKTDIDKCSLPGKLTVRYSGNGTEYIVLPINPVWTDHDTFGTQEVLETVWDSGPVNSELRSYDEIRDFVKAEWTGSREIYDPRSEQLIAKIAAFRAQTK